MVINSLKSPLRMTGVAQKNSIERRFQKKQSSWPKQEKEAVDKKKKTLQDIKTDEGSHQCTPDGDTTKKDRADMLAEFEKYAESKRYIHCLELAQFAEWRE